MTRDAWRVMRRFNKVHIVLFDLSAERYTNNRTTTTNYLVTRTSSSRRFPHNEVTVLYRVDASEDPRDSSSWTSKRTVSGRRLTCHRHKTTWPDFRIRDSRNRVVCKRVATANRTIAERRPTIRWQYVRIAVSPVNGYSV